MESRLNDQVLEVRDLEYEYVTGKGRFRAIDQLSFSVREGEFVSIVGPSGSGKSTLLKTIAGLLRVTTGEIRVSGQVLTGQIPPPVSSFNGCRQKETVKQGGICMKPNGSSKKL